jgi:hypothetical protein
MAKIAWYFKNGKAVKGDFPGMSKGELQDLARELEGGVRVPLLTPGTIYEVME